MSYIPLKVTTLEVGGFMPSMLAMRIPKFSKSDSYMVGQEFVLGENDQKRAGNLIRAGTDHAKFTRGIDVWVKLECQVGWMIEFVTYRMGSDDLSTSSAMHNELKYLKGEELAEFKQEGLKDKVYIRYQKINYQALRAMWKARKNHRHPDWKLFCKWIETLPYAKELILVKRGYVAGEAP